MEDYEELPPHRQISYENRNLIAYSVGDKIGDVIQTGSRLVDLGDIVFAVTDAYTDNFTQDEIAQLLSEAIRENNDKVDIKQIIDHMNGKLQWFMRNRHETDSVRGKQDDASIVMIEVGK